MLQKIAILVIFLTVSGLLIWQRFDIPDHLPVQIVARDGSGLQLDEPIRRGQVIETGKDQRVALRVADALLVLDENTRLDLTDLAAENIVLQLRTGRIVAKNDSSSPIVINTQKTENLLSDGTATFVNFNFLNKLHIAPVEGTIQTQLAGMEEIMLLPIAIEVLESEPPTFTPISFSRDGASEFYYWFDSVLALP